MKLNLIKYFMAILVISGNSACEEIIQLDINNASPEITVEANIAENEPAVVYVRKTASLDDVDDFPAVQGAVVVLSDNQGESEQLSEIRPGVYKSLLLKGKTGKSYILNVKTEDKNITASDIMPGKVALDSFLVLNSVYPGGGRPTNGELAPFYEIMITFRDPVLLKNYYKVNVYVNDTIRDGNNIFDDQYNNGLQVTNNFVMYNENIRRGDTIHIEFMCISKPVYGYFKSMGNASGGPRNSSSPANPYSNLSGSKLGYFSANTIERKYFIVQ